MFFCRIIHQKLILDSIFFRDKKTLNLPHGWHGIVVELKNGQAWVPQDGVSETPGLWQRTVEESEYLQRLDDDAAVEDVRPTADRHELVDDRPLLVAAQLFEEDHSAGQRCADENGPDAARDGNDFYGIIFHQSWVVVVHVEVWRSVFRCVMITYVVNDEYSRQRTLT